MSPFLVWPSDVESQAAEARRVFAEVAPRYALMKWLLSAGLEPRAKRRALERNLGGRRGRVLDLATGNGEVLKWIADNLTYTDLVGVDISDAMLRLVPKDMPAMLVQADVNALPFRGSQFDVVTAAYGLRYTDPPVFIRSTFELLGKGGRLVLFDLANPKSRFMRGLWHVLLLIAGTTLGLLLHGRARTYWHLVETLRRHPSHVEIADLLRTAGFSSVRVELALGGLLAVHVADKGASP